jgi:hypothetical protein
MSEPIKLKAAGDKHAMQVATAAKLTFGQYPEIEFVGRDGSVVRVPEVSAMRQLGNLSLTLDGIVGKRITIKRDPNAKQPAKPYWGIYLEDGNGNGSGGASAPAAGASTSDRVSQPTSPQPPTQAAPTTGAKEKDSALYLRMAKFALTDVRKLYEGEAMDFPPEVAASITATLFINAKGR